MKTWYHHLSLKLKVVLFMTLLMLIYGCIFSYLSIRSAQKEVSAQLESSHIEIAGQFNNYISTLQTYLLDISSTPYLDRTLLNILADRPSNISGGTDMYLNNFLFRSILSKNDISFAGLTNSTNLKDGYYIAKDASFGLKPYDSLMESSLFCDFNGNGLDYACYPLEKEDTAILTHNVHRKILFIRTIKDAQNSFNLLGYLLLGVNTDSLNAPCSSVIDPATSGLFMTDSSGAPLYEYGLMPDAGFQLPENPGQIQYLEQGGRSYLLCTTKQNPFGWSITYYTDLSLLPDYSMSYTVTTILLTAFAAIAVFFVMASLIASAVTAPLNRLLLSIRRLQEGDFKQHVEIVNHDEIGQLTIGYNHMVDRIKELIEQNYEIKIHEQKAQLAALQTQINPHFLYNTLDLLYWKATAFGQDEIAQIVYSLSRLFRTSLNKGNAWITFQNEEEFLNCYLSLQKSLMSERLTYELIFPDSLHSTYLPRFLLQPVIENALIHGLNDNLENPHVRIHASTEGSVIHISIQDNGKGMDPDEVTRLLQACKDDSPEPENTGYALPNIRRRMELYFDHHMDFSIASSPGCGTEVTLTIPITKTLPEESSHV